VKVSGKTPEIGSRREAFRVCGTTTIANSSYARHLMTHSKHNKARSHRRIASDLALVALATVICAVLAIRFDWTERLFAWTRQSESSQLDELTFTLLYLAIGVAWFSARRWRETRRELDARLLMQSRLARTLGEQRRLTREFVDQPERERKRLRKNCTMSSGNS